MRYIFSDFHIIKNIRERPDITQLSRNYHAIIKTYSINKVFYITQKNYHVLLKKCSNRNFVLNIQL